MTREETQKILAIISATYPNFKVDNKTNTIDIWQRVLQNDSYEKVEVALYAYIRNDKSGFAPTIGQLLNTYSDLTDSSLDEGNAWAMVYKAICNSAYNSEEEFSKLPSTVKMALGSHEDLKRMAVDSNLNLEVEKSHFLRAYRRAVEKERYNRIVGIDINKAIEEHKNKMLEERNV